MKNNLDSLIQKRTSIRQFKNKTVCEKDIEQIVNCARLSPSAKNRQPWKFVAVTNKDVINHIADIMIQWHNENKNNKTSVYATALAMKTSPVLILIFKKSTDNEYLRSDTLSIGSAIENMLLKATNLDLGSLWICDGVYVDSEISNYMKIDLPLYSMVAIGYPDEFPNPRPRNPLKDIYTLIK